MRTPWWLFLSLLVVAAPAVAGAQYIPVPPPPLFAPPLPPRVYIHRRVHWQHGRFGATVIVTPPGPPVWIAPGPASPPPPPVYVTPPPVYVAPQQPIYVQPQPIYVQPPIVTPPPVVLTVPAIVAQRPPLPQWASRFGFGATFEGLFHLAGDERAGFGVMGQLRYRAARHFGLELMGGWERSTDRSEFVRTDVPIIADMIIPILGPEYALSPYFVFGGGVNFADLHIIDEPSHPLDDKRAQLVAQVGFGLELRLGQHFALNADGRVEGRWSIEGPSDAVAATRSIDGKPVHPLSDSTALRLGVGASLYF
jgi:hypothetical protein